MEAIKHGSYYINNLIYFWHGEAYTGSFKGMRFQIHRYPMLNLFEKGMENERFNPDAKIVGHVWPEPYCFEAVPQNEVITKSYGFTEEGLEALRNWINMMYATKFKDGI